MGKSKIKNLYDYADTSIYKPENINLGNQTVSSDYNPYGGRYNINMGQITGLASQQNKKPVFAGNSTLAAPRAATQSYSQKDEQEYNRYMQQWKHQTMMDPKNTSAEAVQYRTEWNNWNKQHKDAYEAELKEYQRLQRSYNPNGYGNGSELIKKQMDESAARLQKMQEDGWDKAYIDVNKYHRSGQDTADQYAYVQNDIYFNQAENMVKQGSKYVAADDILGRYDAAMQRAAEKEADRQRRLAADPSEVFVLGNETVQNDRDYMELGGKHLDLMTDSERNTYYTLFGGDKNAAYKYLDDLQDTLNTRFTASNNMTSKDLADMSTGEKVMTSLTTVPVKLLGAAPAFLDDALHTLRGEEIDPYNNAHVLKNASELHRADMQQYIDEKAGTYKTDYQKELERNEDLRRELESGYEPDLAEYYKQKIAESDQKLEQMRLEGRDQEESAPDKIMTWGKAYQSLMSSADSLLGASLGGTGYGLVMGMDAAASTAKDLFDQGADSSQIMWTALAAGTAEMLFEKFSIEMFTEHLMKYGAKNVFEWLRNVGLSMVNEGSEEFFTEMANYITGAILAYDFSDAKQDMDAYRQTHPDAPKSNAALFAKMLFTYNGGFMRRGAEAAAGGALSGGLMGSFGATTGFFSNRATGQALLDSDRAGNVIQGANEVRDQRKAEGGLGNRLDNLLTKKNAADLTAKMEAGTLSNADAGAIGQLYNLYQEGMLEMDKGKIHDAVKGRLEAIGAKGDADAIASAITKMQTGESLSRAEKAAIKDNAAAKQVLEELANMPKELQKLQQEETTARRESEKADKAAANAQKAYDDNMQRLADSEYTDSAAKEAYQELSENAKTTKAAAEEAAEKAKGARKAVSDFAGNVDNWVQNIGTRLLNAEQFGSNDLKTQAQRFDDKTAKLFSTAYMPGQNVNDYTNDFSTMVVAGMSNANKDNIRSKYTSTINDTQADAAFTVGLNARREYLNNAVKEQLNGGTENGSNLREGSQRQNGTGTEGSVQNVGSSAGANPAGQTDGRGQSANRSNIGKAAQYVPGQEVSTKDLGIGNNGARNIIVVSADVVPGGMEMLAEANKRGLGVVFLYANGSSAATNFINLAAEGEPAHYIQGEWDGDTVYVQVNSIRADGEEIFKHEVTHDDLDKGRINKQDVIDQIREAYKDDPEGLKALEEGYAKDMLGIRGEDYVLEEIICDAVGGMNMFSRIARGSLNTEELLQVARSKAEESRATIQKAGNEQTSKGDGASNDAKMSSVAMAEETDAEKAERLRNATISVVTADEISMPGVDISGMQHMTKQQATPIIRAIAEKFNDLQSLKNRELDIEFTFSNTGISRSTSHQIEVTGMNYSGMAYVAENLSAMCQNAYPAEIHKDYKPKGVSEIDKVITLFSVLQAGDSAVFAKFTIKVPKNAKARLHMAIATEVKKGINLDNITGTASLKPVVKNDPSGTNLALITGLDNVPVGNDSFTMTVPQFLEYVKEYPEFVKRIPVDDIIGYDSGKAVAKNAITTDGAYVLDADGRKHSIVSMQSDIAEGQMFRDLESNGIMTKSEIQELQKNISALVDYMIPFRDILDMNETHGREGRRFSPYKPNSDPLYRISMDFSTLCSKRLLTQYVIEQLQLREQRPMSAEEQMAIRSMLNDYRQQEKGLQVACAMCYVEAARLKSPKQIDQWLAKPGFWMQNYFADKNKEFAAIIKQAQEEYKIKYGYQANTPKKDMKPSHKKELDKIRPRLREEYKMSADEQKIADRAASLPVSTFLTAANLANLRESDPEIYDAYTAKIRSATRSKSLEADEPYYYGDSTRDNGNGIVVTDAFIEAVNRENGMRFSSWSDWRIHHMLDYITAVIDNSVRGAAMHGYTKFTEEVRVLGKTGMMFNLSGVAGTQTGLNEDGSLNFSPTESIAVDMNRESDTDALAMRDRFPDTAGLQCIGVGDDHIRALLQSDIIDYVIPYHTSGLNASLRRMANIYGWQDYTKIQNASIDKSIQGDSSNPNWHVEPVFSEFFVGYNTGMSGIDAMRASAENYKRMCRERGMTPKFEKFSNEDNYWKLLIDRKMINQKTGALIQQKPVRPVFDFAEVRKVVDEYVANYDSGLEARALKHIVDNWDSVPGKIKELKAAKKSEKKASKAVQAADTIASEMINARAKHSTVAYGVQQTSVSDQENAKADLATMKAQPNTFADRQTGEQVKYSVVTDGTQFDVLKNPDGSTKYVYKAFYAMDGKLYPPMVANLSDEERKSVKGAASGTMRSLDTPVGVWLRADVGTLGRYKKDASEYDVAFRKLWSGSSKEVKALKAALKQLGIDTTKPEGRAYAMEQLEQVVPKLKNASKETIVEKAGELVRNSTGRLAVENAKGGDVLAFRPGWHLGEWPDAKQFNKDSKLGKKTVMPDGLVFAKCEIAAGVDYQLDAMSYGVKANGKYDRTQAGLPTVPENGYYKYRTNPDPKTAPWYITGAMRVVEILDDDDCARICAEYGVTADPRESFQKIDLAKYGLKRGPVTAPADLKPYEKSQQSYKNDSDLKAALEDPAYRNAYVKGTINFEDPEILKEFERNGQDAAEYKKKYNGAKYSTVAQRGRSIEQETMENNRFKRLQPMFDNLPKQWYAYTKDNFYVYDNYSYTDYKVIGHMPIEGNEAYIEAVKGLIEDGTFTGTETFDSMAASYRMSKGHDNWDYADDEYVSKAQNNDGLDGRTIVVNGDRSIQQSRRNLSRDDVINLAIDNLHAIIDQYEGAAAELYDDMEEPDFSRRARRFSDELDYLVVNRDNVLDRKASEIAMRYGGRGVKMNPRFSTVSDADIAASDPVAFAQIQKDIRKLLDKYGQKLDKNASQADIIAGLRDALQEEAANHKDDIDMWRYESDRLLAMLRMKDASIDRLKKHLADREQEIRETNKAKRKQAQEFETRQKVIFGEFKRIVRDYESNGREGDLKELLSEEAKKHKREIGSWDRELQRLRMAYDQADRNVEKLEKKILEQQKRAKDKVENRKRTEIRNKIKKVYGQLQGILDHPQAAETKHAPRELIRPLAEFCSMFAGHELAHRNLQEASTNSERRKAQIQKAKQNLTNLITRYEAMQGTEGVMGAAYSQEAVDMLRKLSTEMDKWLTDESIYDMNSENLQMVYDTMKKVMHEIVDANRLRSMSKTAELVTVTNRLRTDINDTSSAKSKPGKFWQLYEMWQMRPDTFFEYICGFAKGNVGKDIAGMFQSGTERMLEVQQEYDTMFNRLINRSKQTVQEVKNLGNTKKLVKYGLMDMAGNEVATTRGMMLSVYKHLSQEDSLRSMAYGGLKLPNMDEYYHGNIQAAYGGAELENLLSSAAAESISEVENQIRQIRHQAEDGLISAVQAEMDIADLEDRIDDLVAGEEYRLLQMKQNIEGMLTPLEQALLAASDDWMIRSGDLIADTFYDLNGYDMKRVDNYWTIHRDTTTIASLDTVSVVNEFNLANSGMTKERVKARNPILLTDFFQELNSNRNKVSRYVGFALAQKDFNKIWKMKAPGSRFSIEGLVAAKFQTGKHKLGASGTEYVEHLLQNISGTSNADDGIFGGLYGASAGATLSANLRVAISQLASLPTAAAEVGWANMAKGVAAGFMTAASKEAREQLARDSVWFYQRYKGEGSTTEVADLRKSDGVWGSVANSRVGKALFNWCQSMDVLATGPMMWKMAEASVQERGMKPGDEGYTEAVKARYADIIRRTQPNYTETERSDLLRDKRTSSKILTMYKTQSNQNLNILMDANKRYNKMVRDLKANKNGVTQADVTEARKQLANAYTGVVIGGTIAFALLRFLGNAIQRTMNAYRDDDTDEVTTESAIKGIAKDAISSIAGMFAIGSNIFDMVYAAISGDQYYGMSDNAVGVLNDSLDSMVKFVDAVKDDDPNMSKIRKRGWKFAKDALVIVGVPAGNIEKIISMGEGWYGEIRSGDLFQYDSDSTTSTQYHNRYLQAFRDNDAEKMGAINAMWLIEAGETDPEKAASKVQSGMSTYLHNLYKKRKLDNAVECVEILQSVGMSFDDATKKVAAWEFKLAHPNTKLSDTGIAKWNANKDIPLDVFEPAYLYKSDHKTKEELVRYIQSLNISSALKKKLWNALKGNWKDKDTPWA